MNQNAKAFIWQFTYAICLKSVTASEYNTVLWRVHRLLALAIPAASFPASQLFPSRNLKCKYAVTDILNYLSFLKTKWITVREN